MTLYTVYKIGDSAVSWDIYATSPIEAAKIAAGSAAHGDVIWMSYRVGGEERDAGFDVYESQRIGSGRRVRSILWR